MTGAIVNPDLHEVVVVLDGTTLPFMKLSTAVLFLENHFGGNYDAAKLFNTIATAMGDDKEDNIQIYDAQTYYDLFMDDEDENESDDE